MIRSVCPLCSAGILRKIPAELAADRAVPAHCAGTALCFLHSPQWGIGRTRTVCPCSSDPADGRKIGFLPSANADLCGGGQLRVLADGHPLTPVVT